METAEIYTAQKRQVAPSSDGISPPPKRRDNKESPITQDVEMEERPISNQVPRRKRNPPRRLPVRLNKKDVWKKLAQTEAGLSMADWVSLDKAAYKDVVDGLRYLHGRKVKKVASSKAVNLVDVEVDEDEDAQESEDMEESEWSEDYSSTEESEYDSDDTECNYPYDYETMKKSRPMRAPVAINGEVVQAVFDSGASVSVISRKLAQRLVLKENKDELYLTGIDKEIGEPSRIAPNVPIRVAGKLRHEHMCILDTERDLCLIGMTWFRAHDVRLVHKTNTIVIPTKQGTASVELQGQSIEDKEEAMETPAPILSVSIRDQSDPVKDVVGYMEETMTEPDYGPLPGEVEAILSEFDDCFVENSGLGRVEEIAHTIETTTDRPIRSRPYRLSWEEEECLRKEIDQLLELGLIRPSKGEWTSPVFFVRKRSGALRLVVNYQRLNSITVKDAFPLPRVYDLLDSLGGAEWFSTLDAASGYWQVPMDEDSVEKTGFVCRQGTFAWNVMPFGLTSAPSTYTRMMEKLLGPYIGKFCYVFIDDVVVFSRTFNEHMQHLVKIMDICKAANLKLKKSKCVFVQRKVEYLGHEVGRQQHGAGLWPCGRNVDKIMNMRSPKNERELRSVLGLLNFYRRFVPNYAERSEPLTRLLSKGRTFTWEEEQEKAFKELKEYFTKPPLLDFPDREKVQILTTDASTTAIGAILSQSPTGSTDGEGIIAYASRKLRGSELNYSATHLEALAVVWGIKQFRHYLAGRKFVLRSDHAALQFVLSNPSPNPKMQRWAAAIMEYDFIFKHQPGSKNPADPLSRMIH